MIILNIQIILTPNSNCVYILSVSSDTVIILVSPQGHCRTRKVSDYNHQLLQRGHGEIFQLFLHVRFLALLHYSSLQIDFITEFSDQSRLPKLPPPQIIWAAP